MASGTLFEPAAAALTQLMGSAEFENERTRHKALLRLFWDKWEFYKISWQPENESGMTMPRPWPCQALKISLRQPGLNRVAARKNKINFIRKFNLATRGIIPMGTKKPVQKTI